MANSIFNALSKNGQAPGGNNRLFQNFSRFMNQMKGKNPNEVLQQMVNSGQINQNQLNQAQQMAQKYGNQLEGFKSMFGFK